MNLPDIPTAVTEAEVAKLVELARGKRVLEVGSLLGFSTVCLSRVAEVVHAVDPHAGYPDHAPRPTLLPFLENLERYEVRHKVVPHIGTIQEVGPWLKEEAFDLIFIDTSGHYRDTIEAMQATNHLLYDGHMCVHDYDLAGWPGVKQAVDGFALNEAAEIELVGTLAVLGW